MADYQKMYAMLFNAITDAITKLQKVQQDAENLYITAEEAVIELMDEAERVGHIESWSSKDEMPRQFKKNHNRKRKPPRG